MIKRLIPFLFLLSVASNALAAVPPHQDGEGGCSSECCQTARHQGQDAVASKLCCLSECQELAETSNPHTAIASHAQQQRHVFAPRFFSLSEPVFSAPRTEFPTLPARHLNGLPNRYLETHTLLI